MSSRRPHTTTQGPFYPAQLQVGGDYELSNGHPVYCAPTGGDGGGPNLRGGFVLDTDPMAANAGVDLGMQLGEYTMRAPDIAVGAFPEKRGWVQGALPLAVEYAGSGQDEEDLQERVEDLLAHGVLYVWVVRLVGPRRVEVHERGKAMRNVLPGESLTAPGVLQNPVPVVALYDRDAAHEVALANLLQRKGYPSLDAVRSEGIEEGIERGIEKGIEMGAGALEHLFARRLARPLTEAERATLRERLRTDGSERIGDLVLDLTPDALAAWLHTPEAR
ncbi:MAG: Uma2 family endonuclease [Polyangiales bacterium]